MQTYTINSIKPRMLHGSDSEFRNVAVPMVVSGLCPESIGLWKHRSTQGWAKRAGAKLQTQR